MFTSTSVSRISRAGMVRMFLDNTTISASFPGVRDPLRFSSNAAYAASDRNVHLDLRLQDLPCRNGQDVSRQHHHICEFSRCQGSFEIFLERGIRRVRSECSPRPPSPGSPVPEWSGCFSTTPPYLRVFPVSGIL